jgi:hypothetical protein
MYHLRVKTENEEHESQKRKAKRKAGSRDQMAVDDLIRRNALGSESQNG